MNATLYQIMFDGDVILYALTDTQTVPQSIASACWTEYDQEHGWDPTYLTDRAKDTLEAVGYTVTVRKFDGNAMRQDDNQEFNDGDIDEFWKVLQARIDASGNDTPITTLPEEEAAQVIGDAKVEARHPPVDRRHPHALTVDSEGHDLAAPFEVEIREFSNAVVLVMHDPAGTEVASVHLEIDASRGQAVMLRAWDSSDETTTDAVVQQTLRLEPESEED